MKISKKCSHTPAIVAIAAPLFFALGVGGTTHAEEIPRDLMRTANIWAAAEKAPEASHLVSVTPGSFDEDNNLSMLLFNELESLHEQGSIQKLHYSDIEHKVRESILATIFPNNIKSPSFCGALSPVELSMPEGEELTAEEFTMKQMKADISKCRRVFRDLFGGIIYADPKVVLLDVMSEVGQKVTIWIASLVNPKEFLRIDLTL